MALFSTAARLLAFECKAGWTMTSLRMAGKPTRACLAPYAEDFNFVDPKTGKVLGFSND
jgi:hypothetical protein